MTTKMAAKFLYYKWMIYQRKEKPEICPKQCLGKNKLDTKTELKAQNNPIWPKNPR
jgi:hypothetical protein